MLFFSLKTDVVVVPSCWCLLQRSRNSSSAGGWGEAFFFFVHFSVPASPSKSMRQKKASVKRADEEEDTNELQAEVGTTLIHQSCRQIKNHLKQKLCKESDVTCACSADNPLPYNVQTRLLSF